MKTTDLSTLDALHRLAATRGDGLRPELLEALSRIGSVSGPPPASVAALQATVVRLDFHRSAARGMDDSSPAADQTVR